MRLMRHMILTLAFSLSSLAFGQDVEDMDTDGDGIPDVEDNCPLEQNESQVDSDRDGLGDVCDNCRDTYNPGQENTGGYNTLGDACDGIGFFGEVHVYAPLDDPRPNAELLDEAAADMVAACANGVVRVTGRASGDGEAAKKKGRDTYLGEQRQNYGVEAIYAAGGVPKPAEDPILHGPSGALGRGVFLECIGMPTPIFTTVPDPEDPNCKQHFRNDQYQYTTCDHDTQTMCKERVEYQDDNRITYERCAPADSWPDSREEYATLDGWKVIDVYIPPKERFFHAVVRPGAGVRRGEWAWSLDGGVALDWEQITLELTIGFGQRESLWDTPFAEGWYYRPAGHAAFSIGKVFELGPRFEFEEYVGVLSTGDDESEYHSFRPGAHIGFRVPNSKVAIYIQPFYEAGIDETILFRNGFGGAFVLAVDLKAVRLQFRIDGMVGPRPAR